jgi:hypothetical protein
MLNIAKKLDGIISFNHIQKLAPQKQNNFPSSEKHGHDFSLCCKKNNMMYSKHC